MRYLLNSAVITGPGTFRYRLVDRQEATAWLAAGPAESRIGYETTASFVEALGGWRPALSRTAAVLEVGDEALVVRLKYRMSDPQVKGALTPGDNDWELGILKRTE